MNTCVLYVCVCVWYGAGGGEWTLMGDEKETWKVKTLDEILLEKKRRRELEEKTDPKRQKNVTYPKATQQLIWHQHVETVLKTSSYQFYLLQNFYI